MRRRTLEDPWRGVTDAPATVVLACSSECRAEYDVASARAPHRWRQVARWIRASL